MFASKEARTAGFAVKRLDWMTADINSPEADEEGADRAGYGSAPMSTWTTAQNLNRMEAPCTCTIATIIPTPNRCTG